MPREPQTKRVIAFVDGQNLFYAAKSAFGYSHPNYDVKKLTDEICSQRGWELQQVRFYTGLPDPKANDWRTAFWNAKLARMGRQGIYTYTRPTRGGREKGIDLRIGLDVVSLAIEGAYDVGLIFSQDQDLSEAADEIRRIIRRDRRWLKLASAFPYSPSYRNRRGINSTDWIEISRSMYDRCLDPRDYRPKTKKLST